MKTIITIFMVHLSLQLTFGQDNSETFRNGTDHFFKKEYQEALNCFEKEYRKNPSVNVKFWIGHTNAEMGKVTQAKPLFLQIINSGYVGPEREMSLVNVGNCYAVLKQPDSAYFYYDWVIKEFPGMAGGYFNKGVLLYKESKFKEAEECFDRSIEIEPDNWFAYQKRLEVCFALQDYESALHDLKKVKALKPDVNDNINFAFCYSMLKRYREADSVFQLIYNEKDALFLNNYGLNKYHMGNIVEGKALIMKSLVLYPDNSYAYRNLAEIAISENDLAKACEYLNKAKTLEFERYYGTEVNDLLLRHCH